ncbi:T-box transcription factor TBX15 [Lates japonicus]|uniref:T-box transcription factor TBX15 n=1 Tax=Lates japonicus TaxID=270547 RepID=A0AAD3MMR6_LATJO|nr:T-box transcription factor TBX15 [Lates japonicus]
MVGSTHASLTAGGSKQHWRQDGCLQQSASSLPSLPSPWKLPHVQQGSYNAFSCTTLTTCNGYNFPTPLLAWLPALRSPKEVCSVSSQAGFSLSRQYLSNGSMDTMAMDRNTHQWPAGQQLL